MINPIKEKIKKYLRHGFYYGHNFELTLNAQKRTIQREQVQQNMDGQQVGVQRTYIGDEKSMDTRYMWNFNMCKDFKA